jgi:hypothetical protein
MGVLNDYVINLPTLKDSPKAVLMTKNGNIPFGEADLATIVLASVPVTWQDQYNLTHLTVPKSSPMLLPVEKNEKLKAKGKTAAARPDAKSNPNMKASGGSSDQVPKKAPSEKFCQCCKAHSSPYQIYNTLACHCYDSNGKPLTAAAGKSSESKKPNKKFGADKSMAFVQTMIEACVKAKKAGKSMKRKKRTMIPATFLTVNRKLGVTTRILV